MNTSDRVAAPSLLILGRGSSVLGGILECVDQGVRGSPLCPAAAPLVSELGFPETSNMKGLGLTALKSVSRSKFHVRRDGQQEDVRGRTTSYLLMNKVERDS